MAYSVDIEMQSFQTILASLSALRVGYLLSCCLTQLSNVIISAGISGNV